MPVRWQVDGNWTIAANSIQYWNWNFFTDPGPTGGPNQGPIVFRAIPKGISQGGNNTARNVLVTYDFAMCRGGPGDDHAPEVFYEFKIRNDSSVAGSVLDPIRQIQRPTPQYLIHDHTTASTHRTEDHHEDDSHHRRAREHSRHGRPRQSKQTGRWNRWTCRRTGSVAARDRGTEGAAERGRRRRATPQALRPPSQEGLSKA